MTQACRLPLAMLAALALPISTMSAFAQCAMCRASLLHSQGGTELMEGLRQGVVVLLAMPLIIAALVLIRLQRAAKASAEPATQQRMHNGESRC